MNVQIYQINHYKGKKVTFLFGTKISRFFVIITHIALQVTYTAGSAVYEAITYRGGAEYLGRGILYQ